MKKRLANFSLMALLTLTLSVHVSVRADHFNDYNTRVDYSYTQYDECTEEDVLIAVTMHIHQREVIDGNGGAHTTFDANTQSANGIGLTSGKKTTASRRFFMTRRIIEAIPMIPIRSPDAPVRSRCWLMKPSLRRALITICLSAPARIS